MKKILIISLIFSFILLTNVRTMAAMHNDNGDFTNPFLYRDRGAFDMPKFEGWYYVEKDAPSATICGKFPKSESGNSLGLEYFLTDQTFFDLIYNKPASGKSHPYLKGSYHFTGGLFCGIDYISYDDYSHMDLSPGFRLDFPRYGGYIAASMDYSLKDDSGFNGGMMDYEIDTRFYTRESRVYGQIIVPNPDIAGKDTYLHAGGAYQMGKRFVIGCDYTSWGDMIDRLEVGCSTYIDSLRTEVKYHTDSKQLDFNLIYPFSRQLRAGIEAWKYQGDRDTDLFAKAKYEIDNRNSVMVRYRFKNDANGGALTYLSWSMDL